MEIQSLNSLSGVEKLEHRIQIATTFMEYVWNLWNHWNDIVSIDALPDCTNHDEAGGFMEFLHGNFVRIKRMVMLDNITTDARRQLMALRTFNFSKTTFGEQATPKYDDSRWVPQHMTRTGR